MLYRFALALGLFLLGMRVGRELSRTAPVRARLKQSLAAPRLHLVPTNKALLH